jgi:glycosyltransferase involved in cell wall biosynthesis
MGVLMISVIVPTWNRADFVARAVASVLAQTLPPAEILVVDDGSVDNTREVIDRLTGQNGVELRYLYQEHRGVSAARNRGIVEARGEMFCFLDSDDTWVPQKLALQYAAMERSPEYLISHTRETWYRHGKRVNQKKKHDPGSGDIFARSLAMCVVGMSTVMARRALFDRYGLFDEDLLCCEDYDLWLRVSCREDFLLVDAPLTVKDGGRPDQLSAVHRLGMDTWRIRSLCKLLDSGVLDAGRHNSTLAELARKCTIYGNGCIKHGRPEEGRKYLDLPRQYGARNS